MVVVIVTSKRGFLIPKDKWEFDENAGELQAGRKEIYTPELIKKLREQLENRFENKYESLGLEIDKLDQKRKSEIDKALEEEGIQIKYLEDELNDYWKKQKLIKRLGRKGFLLGVPIARAWIPYIIIGTVLLLTRVIATLKPDSFAASLKNVKLVIPGADGEVFWSFAFLWNPGVIFVVVAIISIFILRIRSAYVKRAWLKSFDQVRGAAIPLLFEVGMVYVLRNSANPSVNVFYLMSGEEAGLGSMLAMMADGLGYLFKSCYLWVSPLVGMVGAFISGSNTVSNTLFSGLQFETALMLGLPQVIVRALQNAGGAIGNMICVNNVVSASATTGISGNEGRIIRLNIVPCILFWLLLSAAAIIFFN